MLAKRIKNKARILKSAKEKFNIEKLQAKPNE